MQINVVTEPIVEEESWSDNITNLVVKGFIDLRHRVQVYTYEDLKNKEPNKCDVWFLHAVEDWDGVGLTELAEKRGEPCVGILHGGPEVFGFVDREEPKRHYDTGYIDLLKRMHGICFNTETHRDQFLSYWKDRADIRNLNCYVTGFPIEGDRFRNYGSKRDIDVVVPARFNWVKQPLIAAKILEPWKDKVVFSTGWKLGSGWAYCPSDEIAETECYARILKMWGYRIFDGCQGSNYSDLLANSKVALFTSFYESACVSALEAMFSGCNVIVPDIPPFDHYASFSKFRPYDISEARGKIGEALVSKGHRPALDDIEWYDYKEVVKRMEVALFHAIWRKKWKEPNRKQELPDWD